MELRFRSDNARQRLVRDVGGGLVHAAPRSAWRASIVRGTASGSGPIVSATEAVGTINLEPCLHELDRDA